MLLADEYFLSFGLKSENHRRLARVILTVQVKTYRLTGHLLDLGERGFKEHAEHAASRGSAIAFHPRCLRCGWRAKWADWSRAVTFSPPERERAIELLKGCVPDGDIAFLCKCGGDEHMRELGPFLADIAGVSKDGQ